MLVKPFARGFTLLEIMLVIVIMSISMIYFASLLKRRTEEATIDATVVGMQRWLQAGSAYYLQNKDSMTNTYRWPASLVDLSPTFLPPEAVCSPWHTQIGGAVRLCQGRTEYRAIDIAPGDLFWGVSIRAPNNKIAQRIAARLPSAAVAGREVTAFTPAPTYSLKPLTPALLVKGIGRVNVGVNCAPFLDKDGINGTPILPATCPPGWTSDWQPAMAKLNQYQAAKQIQVLTVLKNEDAELKPKPNRVFIFLNMTTGGLNPYGGFDSHCGDAFIISFCVPPNYCNGNVPNPSAGPCPVVKPPKNECTG